MRSFLIWAVILSGNFACGTREKSPPSGQLDTVPTVRYFGAEGKTALELLEAKHRVEKKTSSAGSFVEAIDGIKNRSDQFWLYYVNGRKPDVASDRYFTTSKDAIEWHFEKNYKEGK